MDVDHTRPQLLLAVAHFMFGNVLAILETRPFHMIVTGAGRTAKLANELLRDLSGFAPQGIVQATQSGLEIDIAARRSHLLHCMLASVLFT